MNERLKELRKHLNLTMEKFGEKLGVGKTAISGIESGRRNPSDQLLKSICREFNVREEWIRTGNGEMFESFAPASNEILDALASEYNLSHEAYIAIERFMNLKPEAQRQIIEYFTSIAKALSNVPVDVPMFPSGDLSHLSIEEKVDLYRRELEREEKAEDGSSASQEGA